MCLYSGVRCAWTCGSSGGAVHVNGGVREGSPSRRSYEGCATIGLKNTKVFLKVRKILDIQPNYSDQTRGTKAAITAPLQDSHATQRPFDR